MMIFFMTTLIFLGGNVAHALELEGALTQGGYIYGKAPKGSRIFLGETPLKTDVEGHFFAGLHRHFPPEGELFIKTADGQTTKTAFLVTPQTYKVQHIKGVQKKHVNPDPEQINRSQKEAAHIRQARAPFTPAPYAFERFGLPVKNYPLSGVYGSSRTYNGEERNWHKGLDIAAPEGTPVYAPQGGIVRAALADTFFNGNLIVVDHGYGLFSIYGHLRHMAVTVGEKINRGDVLGEVGQTGRATGPHLHWGVYWHNIALDPKLVLHENERTKLKF